jgi:hypothetical protein
MHIRLRGLEKGSQKPPRVYMAIRRVRFLRVVHAEEVLEDIT